MIFYFSGCGNSRGIARQLANVQQERLIFIPDVIEGDCTFALKGDEAVGFVFPVYSWAPPKIVIDFIGRLKLENYSGQYLFMVCTCGDDIGLTRQVFTSAIERRGWRVDSAFSIQMPNTYVCLPGFDVDTPERRAEKLQKAEDRLQWINEQILQKVRRRCDVLEGAWAWMKTRIVYPFFQRFLMSDKPFRSTDRCIGYEICKRACPVGNIRMTDGRPAWLHHCTLCLGCYHHCPTHAVEYGRYTAGKGQYVHPDHTARKQSSYDQINPPDNKFIALILAAGRSSRMGELKPLLKLDGQTVLEKLLNTYRSAGVSDVLVVLGHQADEIQPLLEAQGVSWIVNERYDRGMFSSIQTGVQHLSPNCDAFFLQPADIPLIRPETIQSLISVRREKKARICYPCSNGRRGHPPLICASLIPAIEAFDGTGGMRALLSRYQDAAINVDVDDPGIHFDMDTPEDYERIELQARGKTF